MNSNSVRKFNSKLSKILDIPVVKVLLVLFLTCFAGMAVPKKKNIPSFIQTLMSYAVFRIIILACIAILSGYNSTLGLSSAMVFVFVLNITKTLEHDKAEEKEHDIDSTHSHTQQHVDSGHHEHSEDNLDGGHEHPEETVPEVVPEVVSEVVPEGSVCDYNQNNYTDPVDDPPLGDTAFEGSNNKDPVAANDYDGFGDLASIEGNVGNVCSTNNYKGSALTDNDYSTLSAEEF
tara:strand:- start:31 stop:729 length:699 start_codon:yes stop_codon:yes gene_type:complete